MSERDAHDRRVLTLLVQLFGRDVLDRLASAGFDGPAAIARAGADRLAAEGGIPLAVAQRLAVVVAESCEPEPGVQEEKRPGKAGARKRAAARTPAARTARVAASTPDAPAVPDATAASDMPAAPTGPDATAASTGPTGPDAPVPPAAQASAPPARASFDEGDPFVDDVALVSWLGLSSHRPEGRLAFTVSDSILDPVEGDGAQLAEGDGPQPAEADRPRPAYGEGRRAAAADERPAAETRSEPPERPRTLTGSFWSFGRAPDPTLPSTGRKADPQPPAATPRRRKYDGH